MHVFNFIPPVANVPTCTDAPQNWFYNLVNKEPSSFDASRDRKGIDRIANTITFFFNPPSPAVSETLNFYVYYSDATLNFQSEEYFIELSMSYFTRVLGARKKTEE